MIAILVICDSCQEKGSPGVGRVDMHKLHGWTFDGRHDYCPSCAPPSWDQPPVTRTRYRK